MRATALLALAASCLAPCAAAEEPTPAAPPDVERWALHYQATVATQAHPSFPARYSGPNSMRADGESATSVVMDLFAAARVWSGGELHVQPELAGGRGLSGTLGVAAFPSGEVYRVGDPTPRVVLARAFLRQIIGLGGGPVDVESGPRQLRGRRDRDALTLTVGKIAATDFVDVVPVSDDPHTGFLSWGLFASGAYDYPADTRGYTWGAAADLTMDWWSVRAGVFLEPKEANQLDLEWRVDRARGVAAEFEVRYSLARRPGAARLLVYVNEAHMGSYAAALAAAPVAPDVTATRADGRRKYGFVASANQELGGGRAAFLRASWNDGQTETWAFTEIDRSVAAGLVQAGSPWRRPDDEAGLGIVVSGLSDVHRRYLEAGGHGFILGDGALRSAPEVLVEAYYRAAVTRAVALSVHYQPVVNPGYNADRGPIHVFTALAHVAF